MEQAPEIPITAAMPGAATPPAHPWRTAFALDASLALLLRSSGATAILWLPRGHGSASIDVPGRAALCRLVALLGESEWAIVVHAGGEHRWAQVMGTDDAWIVEVHDGSETDWASRIVRGQRGAERRDRFSPDEAASAIWAWMHGGLPAGLERVRLSPQRSGVAADGREWCTADLT